MQIIKKKRHDISNYEVDWPLPQGMNKKVIDVMNDELGGKIITEFVALRPKTYSYDKNVKKLKEQKKYLRLRIIKAYLRIKSY